MGPRRDVQWCEVIMQRRGYCNRWQPTTDAVCGYLLIGASVNTDASRSGVSLLPLSRLSIIYISALDWTAARSPTNHHPATAASDFSVVFITKTRRYSAGDECRLTCRAISDISSTISVLVLVLSVLLLTRWPVIDDVTGVADDDVINGSQRRVHLATRQRRDQWT